MEISADDMYSSTRSIVKALDVNNTLKDSVRIGLMSLTTYLLSNAAERDELEATEKGLYVIDAIDLLADGWEIIPKHMDYGGRSYINGRNAKDAARMHYRLAQTQADEIYLTGENLWPSISDSAYMLGQHILHITRPIT